MIRAGRARERSHALGSVGSAMFTAPHPIAGATKLRHVMVEDADPIEVEINGPGCLDLEIAADRAIGLSKN